MSSKLKSSVQSENDIDNASSDPLPEGLPSQICGREKASSGLTLKLSETLHKKLCAKAQHEGVSPQELAQELLAEGLVLRAWEIIEKKQAMRGASSGGLAQNHHSSSGRQGRFRANSNSRRGGGSYDQQRKGHYRNLMEDRANFLEYVRAQEKKDQRF